MDRSIISFIRWLTIILPVVVIAKAEVLRSKKILSSVGNIDVLDLHIIMLISDGNCLYLNSVSRCSGEGMDVALTGPFQGRLTGEILTKPYFET